jgi:hypothetical protein
LASMDAPIEANGARTVSCSNINNSGWFCGCVESCWFDWGTEFGRKGEFAWPSSFLVDGLL